MLPSHVLSDPRHFHPFAPTRRFRSFGWYASRELSPHLPLPLPSRRSRHGVTERVPLLGLPVASDYGLLTPGRAPCLILLAAHVHSHLLFILPCFYPSLLCASALSSCGFALVSSGFSGGYRPYLFLPPRFSRASPPASLLRLLSLLPGLTSAPRHPPRSSFPFSSSKAAPPPSFFPCLRLRLPSIFELRCSVSLVYCAAVLCPHCSASPMGCTTPLPSLAAWLPAQLCVPWVLCLAACLNLFHSPHVPLFRFSAHSPSIAALPAVCVCVPPCPPLALLSLSHSFVRRFSLACGHTLLLTHAQARADQRALPPSYSARGSCRLLLDPGSSLWCLFFSSPSRPALIAFLLFSSLSQSSSLPAASLCNVPLSAALRRLIRVPLASVPGLPALCLVGSRPLPLHPRSPPPAFHISLHLCPPPLVAVSPHSCAPACFLPSSWSSPFSVFFVSAGAPCPPVAFCPSPLLAGLFCLFLLSSLVGPRRAFFLSPFPSSPASRPSAALLPPALLFALPLALPLPLLLAPIYAAALRRTPPLSSYSSSRKYAVSGRLPFRPLPFLSTLPLPLVPFCLVPTFQPGDSMRTPDTHQPLVIPLSLLRQVVSVLPLRDCTPPFGCFRLRPALPSSRRSPLPLGYRSPHTAHLPSPLRRSLLSPPLSLPFPPPSLRVIGSFRPFCFSTSPLLLRPSHRALPALGSAPPPSRFVCAFPTPNCFFHLAPSHPPFPSFLAPRRFRLYSCLGPNAMPPPSHPFPPLFRSPFSRLGVASILLTRSYCLPPSLASPADSSCLPCAHTPISPLPTVAPSPATSCRRPRRPLACG